MATHKIKDRFFTYCNKLMNGTFRTTNKWDHTDCNSCKAKVFYRKINMYGKWDWVPKKPLAD